MEQIWTLLSTALGLDAEKSAPAMPQMAVRAIVVYLAMIVVLRFAKKRFMGKPTPFDLIVAIMLGSIASRAVTGNAPMVGALVACAAVVALHALFSWLAMRWHGFGTALKGQARCLVRNGRIERAEMRAAHLSDDDLQEELRLHRAPRLEQVAEARLERSGQISVIQKRETKIVETSAAGGVQTIRIELT